MRVGIQQLGYLAANCQDESGVAVAHDNERDSDDARQTDENSVHAQHVDRSARLIDGAVSGVYDVTGRADDIQCDGDHPGGDHREYAATTRHCQGAPAPRGRDSGAPRDRDEHVRDECRERADGDDVPNNAAHPVAGPVDAGEDGVGVKRHDADGEDQAGDGHVEEEDVGRRHVATAGVEHGAHQRVGDDGEGPSRRQAASPRRPAPPCQWPASCDRT